MVDDNGMPYIFRKETKKAISGQVLEEKSLTVQGKSLKDCEKIFNKEWKRKDASK